MSTDRFVTLREPLRNEQEIKRSRFIACLYPVSTAQQARDHIAELRKEFYDARHRPSAFVLGAGRTEARTSDDGEPAGTAGAPMLQALVAHQTSPAQRELSDVLAVVVRYFGGIKLGAGGLTRAYGGAVSEALTHAQLIVRQRMQLMDVHLPLGEAGAIEASLRNSTLRVVATRWTSTEGIVQVAHAPGDDEETRESIAALTSGLARVSDAGSEWTSHKL
ncbi:IMPACT family member yvyE [Propionibacterium freudenreichii]|uniref:IMPACT family protein n=1 Tax=Propionibacterium freudenreichii TaxID=1744 RepID=UPI000541B9F3|nr:YigZ family protein [Propionibacterium freudenreichii]CEH02561.1 Hypothetical protein PFCIRM125_06100 [Propionibacterium freudenreichii]CEH07633.1 Hypothetical protein PFCIRM135_00330 [Propionibacterium freudenreichii]SBN94427.1 IMPACT family member yvyE [Propionibacterium freudenreichii]SCC96011.1 IMPACT family member yvyE [Propionibacterium freudenreichii]